MKKLWNEKIVEAWDENPLAVITVAAFAATAAAKLIDAVSASKGRKAYAKQIDYKIKHRN